MKIRAELSRRRAPICPPEYQVDNVVEIPDEQFLAFLMKPWDHYEFIHRGEVEPHQGTGHDHCLLVLSDRRTDGALVQCGGDGRAMYTAYVARAWDIVQARLDRVADFIVGEGTQRTASGSWYVYCEELEEKFDVAIEEGNGFDAMLKDALERRPEVAQVDISLQHIETTFRPEFCKSLDSQEVKTSAAISPERKAALFDNAVTAVCALYCGEDLYFLLHDSFGLTVQEIREQGYLSDREMSNVCRVPPQVLDGGMEVRDILQLDGVSEFVCLAHKDSRAPIPLNGLKKLMDSGQEDCSALLEARVTDIRITQNGPKLMLEGIEAKELDRLYDMIEEQAPRITGPAM